MRICFADSMTSFTCLGGCPWLVSKFCLLLLPPLLVAFVVVVGMPLQRVLGVSSALWDAGTFYWQGSSCVWIVWFIYMSISVDQLCMSSMGVVLGMVGPASPPSSSLQRARFGLLVCRELIARVTLLRWISGDDWFLTRSRHGSASSV